VEIDALAHPGAHSPDVGFVSFGNRQAVAVADKLHDAFPEVSPLVCANMAVVVLSHFPLPFRISLMIFFSDSFRASMTSSRICDVLARQISACSSLVK